MIWAIGDIHGMLEPLKKLILQIKPLHSEAEPIKLIFLGDYIDHGPASKEVIDFILDLPYEKVFLMGDHEAMFLDYIDNGERSSVWRRFQGGYKTLKCFNMDSKDSKLDNKYLDFLRNLKCSHTEEIGEKKFLFTHAGLNDSYDIDTQLAFKTIEDLKNSNLGKNYYLRDSLLFNKTEPSRKVKDFIMIHGHLPTLFIDKFYMDNSYFYLDRGIPFLKFDNNDEKYSEYLGKYSTEDSRSYNNEYSCWSRLGYDKLISVNIDTAAVMGKNLTAIGLSEKDLRKRDFKIRQIRTNVGYRRREDIRSFKVHIGR